MQPKPAHLGPMYSAQFKDESVAGAYFTRPPYPAELFDVLEGLLPDGPRIVLDLGCGTGDLSIPLAQRSQRVDAVDPSESMLAVARLRQGADHRALRWISASAEECELHGPYSLAVAGESFHWMDWRVVPARIAAALKPDGFLALVKGRELRDVPWAEGLAKLIPRFTENRQYQPYDLVQELVRRRLFEEIGRRTTRVLGFSQTLADYIESFHTRNGFSRDRMSSQRAAEFDRALRSLVEPHSEQGIIRGKTQITVVWGQPLQPHES